MTPNARLRWTQMIGDWLTQTTSNVDDLIDAGIRRLRKRYGREGVPEIQAYMGYASADTVH